MSAPVLIALAATLVAASPKLPTVAQLRWDRRVLLVTAPLADDPAAVTQRRIFAEIASSGDDRDLVLVEVIGNAVHGAGDTADGVRRSYKLPSDRFTVILIGKDGGEKRRSTTPMSVVTLTGTIDAMPMRRNGER